MIRNLTLLLFGTLLATWHGGVALADPVTGWVITNGDSVITDAGTNSPTVTDADGDTIAANIPVVNLSDGEFISLTGTVTISGNSLAGDQFRIGLFDGDDPVTVGDGGGYVGVYAGAPVGTGGAPVKVSDGSATNPFSSSAATVIGTMSAANDTVDDGEPLDFALTIARDGTGLDISASFTNNDGYDSSISLQDQAVNLYTYNSAAFLLGGTLNAGLATFHNIDVTIGVVPEPSAVLLAAICAAAAVAVRRRLL